MPTRLTAHEVFENVTDAAVDELQRSSLGLAFSGLSAGLNIGFSFVAVAAVLAVTESVHAPLWTAAVYPVGFVLVILARAQLFTENTLTPVILILAEVRRADVVNTARLWAVVLAANLLGAYLFAGAVHLFSIAPNVPADAFLHAAQKAFEGTWFQLFVRGIFGGWLIALMVWMLHACEDVVSQVVVVWVAAAVIGLSGFAHSVAGAVEVLYLVLEHVITYGEWLWDFQIPVTLGNIAGGVVFVALVNYAQVVGAGEDVERAARRQRERRAREAQELDTAVRDAADERD